MSQAQHTARMAVLLFTDIEDSVGLQQRLGSQNYGRVLSLHDQFFQQALNSVSFSKILENPGDGFLCEFATAADAVNVALLFQLLLRENRWLGEAPKVRIGIHLGQLAEIAIEDSSRRKLLGMPINIAARIMGLAQGGQILMTRPVYDDARQFIRSHPTNPASGKPPLAVEWKAHGRYFFKGNDESMEVFEVGAVGFAALKPPPDSEKAQRDRPGTPATPRWRRSAVGAALAVLCGLLLWGSALGQGWVDASYDYVFRFGSRAATNQMVLIMMDNAAYADQGQDRAKPWDRRLHARLANRLADDHCPLVVFDVRFLQPRDPEADRSLASAMQRLSNVVLAAEQVRPAHPGLDAVQPVLPISMFLQAARTNWGVAWLDPDLDLVVRRHWPFPSPGPHQSLPWSAARVAGAKLPDQAQDRWIRYYAAGHPVNGLSYHLALSQAPNYFRDKIVFIGSKPRTPIPDSEEDEFRPPEIRWTGETVGGVEILATEFANLVNNDWLRRLPWAVEVFFLLLTGTMAGWTALSLKWRHAWLLGLIAGLAVSILGIGLSHLTNYWFPWLIIVTGQIPCALLWRLVTERRDRATARTITGGYPTQKVTPVNPPTKPVSAVDKIFPFATEELMPDVPEYDLVGSPIGEGSFGKVWLVRNAIGQWQALKVIYQSKFGDNTKPFEAELQGLMRYKPVSELHPGLLRIELVSRKKPEGYFYYVMELGDSETPGWQQDPSRYRARDLETVRDQAPNRCLPVSECLRLAIILADALDFLHRQGLTHRDIKPANVIFVNGRPKLADIGLVANVRPVDEAHTQIGTPGYMPPPPEPAGTIRADIYALGMVLYVIGTGKDPAYFPEISTTLIETSGNSEFLRLNDIILTACQPDPARRYQTTADMLKALREAAKKSSPA